MMGVIIFALVVPSVVCCFWGVFMGLLLFVHFGLWFFSIKKFEGPYSPINQ